MTDYIKTHRAKTTVYIFSCLVPVFDVLILNVIVSFLIGSLQHDINYFFKVLLFSMFFSVIGGVAHYISRLIRAACARDFILALRCNGLQELVFSSYRDMAKKSKDVYVSNLINDISVFENQFFPASLHFIYNLGAFFGFLAVLFFIDYRFGMFVTAVAVVFCLVMKMFEKKTIALQCEVSNKNEESALWAANMFSGADVIKRNRVEKPFIDRLSLKIEQLERKKLEYSVLTQGQQDILAFLGQLFFIVCIFYIMQLLKLGSSLTVAALVLQLSESCVWSLSGSLALYNKLRSLHVLSQKFVKPVSEQDKAQALGTLHASALTENSREIKIRGLTFKKEEKTIFSNVSFEITLGKKYLIVGKSGIGKSTLLNLLSGVLQPDIGGVFIDAHPLEDIDFKSFLQEIAIVNQDQFLFEDTILNNIVLNKNFSAQQLNEVLSGVALEGLISKKEGGLGYRLQNNASELSQGEKQRICIARAAIRNPRILLLDEAFSALDEQTAHAVERFILLRSETVIAVSHRYHPQINELYDFVIELKNQNVQVIPATDYFGGTGV